MTCKKGKEPFYYIIGMEGLNQPVQFTESLNTG